MTEFGNSSINVEEMDKVACRLCGNKEFNDKGSFVDHIREHYVRTAMFYKCKECGLKYKKLNEIVIHIQTHFVVKTNLSCVFCGSSLDSSEIANHTCLDKKLRTGKETDTKTLYPHKKSEGKASKSGSADMSIPNGNVQTNVETEFYDEITQIECQNDNENGVAEKERLFDMSTDVAYQNDAGIGLTEKERLSDGNRLSNWETEGKDIEDELEDVVYAPRETKASDFEKNVNNYNCRICGKIYHTLKRLRKHSAVKHNSFKHSKKRKRNTCSTLEQSGNEVNEADGDDDEGIDSGEEETLTWGKSRPITRIRKSRMKVRKHNDDSEYIKYTFIPQHSLESAGYMCKLCEQHFEIKTDFQAHYKMHVDAHEDFCQLE
ncbi:uncharacterized protein LOC128241373 [Mya arenaria]|uniref:uncharacterized protein LOC128241373 n=1 Tax=Mya arenaria TaxID=6604 RepID=UPI0022E27246|nr:uncharacterized protein LOC128241373 [Mya arenaria]